MFYNSCWLVFISSCFVFDFYLICLRHSLYILTLYILEPTRNCRLFHVRRGTDGCMPDYSLYHFLK